MYILQKILIFIDFNILELSLIMLILKKFIYINNILNLLDLNIANKKQINNYNEFNDYNLRNIIVFNNDNDYISSSFNLVLNYTRVRIKYTIK